jgi:hypothetical protein
VAPQRIFGYARGAVAEHGEQHADALAGEVEEGLGAGSGSSVSAVQPPPTGEALGRRRAHDEFSLEDLRDRLTGAEWYADEDYAAYGLTPPADRRAQVMGARVGDGPGERIHDENA